LEAARPPRWEVAERLLLENREESVADVVFDVARGADDDAAHQELEQPANARHAEQQTRIDLQLLARDALVQIVDRVLEDPRAEQLEDRGRDDADEAGQELGAVTVDVVQEPADRGAHSIKRT